jgi:hypothetical protein
MIGGHRYAHDTFYYYTAPDGAKQEITVGKPLVEIRYALKVGTQRLKQTDYAPPIKRA